MFLFTMTYIRILDVIAASVLMLTLLPLRVVSGDTACENLPTVQNGQLLLEGRQPPFAVNEYISYKCDEDFRSDQINPRITCTLQNNVANWTNTNEDCKPIINSCHDPGDIENADRIGHVFLFPHNITYKCKEGFRMKGFPTKHCSKAGNWLPPNLPSCEVINCPSLLQPQNGEVLFSNRRHNSIATYKCNRNFRLDGSASRVCQADGTWNGSNPICKEITCPDPGILKNGRIISLKASYLASDIVIFQCNDGHHVTSKCLENGEWSARLPTCSDTDTEPVGPQTDVPTTNAQEVTDAIEVNSCEDPGKIKNGYRTIVGLQINSTVIYICDEGYELRGKSTLLCLESGKWDLDKLPICVKPLSVPAIIGIVFGVIIFLSLVVGGYLWYRYRMRGIRGYGKKSKALTADATGIEEITGLEKDRKHIPVTVL